MCPTEMSVGPRDSGAQHDRCLTLRRHDVRGMRLDIYGMIIHHLDLNRVPSSGKNVSGMGIDI